jgi:uncharacterized protein YdbL (DUF1318 family)
MIFMRISVLPTLVITALLSVPVAAVAIDLSAARSKALVCEKPDGFIKAVDGAADVQALVTEVNARRATEYARIAKENNQTVAVAGQLASAQIVAGGAKTCR